MFRYAAEHACVGERAPYCEFEAIELSHNLSDMIFASSATCLFNSRSRNGALLCRRLPQTRSLLLAAHGRQSSGEAALRKHSVQDRGTTTTSGVGEPQTGASFGDEGGGEGKVSQELHPESVGSMLPVGRK